MAKYTNCRNSRVDHASTHRRQFVIRILSKLSDQLDVGLSRLNPPSGLGWLISSNFPLLLFDRRDRLSRRFSFSPAGYVQRKQDAHGDKP